MYSNLAISGIFCGLFVLAVVRGIVRWRARTGSFPAVLFYVALLLLWVFILVSDVEDHARTRAARVFIERTLQETMLGIPIFVDASAGNEESALREYGYFVAERLAAPDYPRDYDIKMYLARGANVSGRAAFPNGETFYFDVQDKARDASPWLQPVFTEADFAFTNFFLSEY